MPKGWKKREPRHTGEAGHIIYRSDKGFEIHIFGRGRRYVELYDEHSNFEKLLYNEKSKSEALKFAHKYMREHPKG